MKTVVAVLLGVGAAIAATNASAQSASSGRSKFAT